MEYQQILLESKLHIHTVVAGDVGLPPLILLHGYPSSSNLWRHFIHRLAVRFRVYAPDLPGHGRSDMPLGVSYDLDFWVRFLLDFFNTLNLDRASLVSHDLGGMISLGFVTRYQKRISRLVVMNTAPYVDWPKTLVQMVSRARHPFFRTIFLTPIIFKWILRTYLVYQSQVISAEVAELYRNPWVKRKNGRRAFSRLVMPSAEELVEPPEKLRKIQVPTLILWGAMDRILPVKFAHRLHQDIPNSKLEIVAKCGHFLQEEEPELLVHHILDFLTAAISTSDKINR
jgi:pimeloyl-ACP methyl ester carboxylesterase